MRIQRLENQRAIYLLRIAAGEAKVAKRKKNIKDRAPQRSKDRKKVVFKEQHMEVYVQEQKDLLAAIDAKLAIARAEG